MRFSRKFLGALSPNRSLAECLSRSLIVTLLTFSVASADDTEIFFSQSEGDPNTHPNIVFVLDNSGSMGGRVPGSSQTKMAAMQAAMNDIIDNVQNINLGLVNFKVGDPQRGSTMVFPVTPIGDPGVRQAMKDVVNAMSPRTATPLVGALYESTMIMRGGNIEETAATYTSPMVGECQNNHIVMLSDGQAWGNNAVPKTQNLVGRSCAASGRSGYETCGVELAQWLNDTDHVPSLSRKKDISVSTIGFNIRSTFLARVADAGGGDYYEASRSDELVDVFNEIITTVKDIDTTFVAPATSINQFNRLTQSNDLFFSMFKPDSKATWSGNLKRYQLGYQGGKVVILDTNNQSAVDSATGLFRETSQSIWSDIVDGNSVELGGAAAEIDSANRRIYTHVGSIPNGGVNLTNVLNESNAALQAMIGMLPTSIRDDILKWIKGKDIQRDVFGAITSSEERYHMGSVLHSTPVTVNYGGGKAIVFVGTNEGFLHAIDKNTGQEDFTFLPQELIPDLLKFYDDTGAKDRPHGLDGEITLHHIDNNGNSVVDSGDKAYLFFGMRRGGDDYYAMDVTNPNTPKLLWRIDGGVGDFARLGQSWSKPIPTKIQHNGNERLVLIFGGGYNTNHDSTEDGGRPTSNQRDQVGSTIYITDALTGKKIWDAYDNIRGISGHMRYAIPSDLRVIDVNGDHFADRMYVGDMGGQLWRFDFTPYHQSSDGVANLVDGGRIADLRTGSNRLRFYNEPDVALMSHNGERFMSVSIGSGWRAHPLDTVVDDRFYMVRDNSPLVKPEGYGKPTGSSFQPVKERDLTDVTSTVLSDRSEQVDMEGWMIKLTDNGEKNLSKSITINNQVIFTSYAPLPPADICSPGSGRGYIYAMDVATGDPVLPLNGGSSSGDLTTDDRKKVLNTESIPPPPTAAITEVGGEIRTSVMAGLETPLNNLPFSDLTQRTYWQDRRRGATTPAACRASGGASCQ